MFLIVCDAYMHVEWTYGLKSSWFVFMFHGICGFLGPLCGFLDVCSCLVVLYVGNEFLMLARWFLMIVVCLMGLVLV